MSLLDKIKVERAKYDANVYADYCADIINNATYQLKTEGWGLSGKDFGAHASRYDGKMVSFEAVQNYLTNHIYDVFQNATLESIPTFNDLGQNTQLNRPYVEPIVPQSLPPNHNCKLGFSCFWLPTGYRDYRERLAQNLAVMKAEGKEFVRIIWKKGSRTSITSPWYPYLIMELSDLTPEFIRSVHEFVYSFGLKCANTIFGDYENIPTSDQRQLIRNFASATQSIPHMVEYWEIFNEPYPDGGGHGGDKESLRSHATLLRELVGSDAIIALGTPQIHMGLSDEERQRQIREMYGNLSSVNAITLHFDRSFNQPPPDVPRHLLKICGEPIGPFSSSAQESNASKLAFHYRMCVLANYYAYVYHCDSGIWSNLINPLYKTGSRGNWANIFDIPNSNKIGESLKFICNGIDIFEGDDEMGQPYPDESEWGAKVLEPEVVRLYKKAFDEGKRATSDLDPAAFRWFMRIGYTIRSGFSKEAAMEKHLKEMCDVLGIER